MDKYPMLIQAYEQLGLDFTIDTRSHLYIKLFPIYHFNRVGNLIIYGLTGGPYRVTSGCLIFGYCDIYEILLWYWYYAISKKHIQRQDHGCWHNEAYFSRIPPYYRNIDPQKGLTIVKKALDKLLIAHKGIPKSFDPNLLNQLYQIK